MNDPKPTHPLGQAREPAPAVGERTGRTNLLAHLAGRAAEREHASLLRRVRTVDHVEGPWLEIDGRRLLGFCSNDYLGLAQHPQLIAAFKRVADDEGVGGTSAHLVCGHRREHAMLEEALADWTGRERALLFSTGYAANLGALQALLGGVEGAVCVQDKLNHACLIDGVQLAGAELKRYPHADVDGAARQLRSRPQAPALLATDGVFSMDGDLAPLRDLAALAASEGATLMVDDAHGLGVLGARGAGSVTAAGLSTREVPVLMATLGKALGCAGAFVAGSAALIEGLTQFARPFVYSTAMPPALAAAALAAVQIAREDDARREKLAALIARFRRGAGELGLPLMRSDTPIQPLLLGDADTALTAALRLETQGLLVTAIRPPTVPAGQARLRITLSAAHEEEHVDRLLDALTALRLPAAG
ncbi:8-amino-7-oxononanoate synthase [Dyella sp.]|jgi:8-amino-7-oxononanoate synthase|uniref:8-amino-7-oxononanoate synthase n=1 Tax=Dyella sp. TaxID=1869338 RepID=UPI002D77F497|nr:8-amino-7-oxononanoate synthase [Dyella sp.]HET6431528.1 8-amino-7-oxononanoate synthase [Dyella sp.]